MEETNNQNKTMIWIAVGCIAIVACILALILLCFGSLLLLGIQQIPGNNFNVQVNVPLSSIIGNAQAQVTAISLSPDALASSGMDVT